MNISRVINQLRQLGVSSKTLALLQMAASRLEEDLLPRPVTKNLESTFMVNISKALTWALDDVGVSYKGPNFSWLLQEKPPLDGPSICEILDKPCERKPHERKAMTAGGPPEDEIEDWQKSLWEELPWEKK